MSFGRAEIKNEIKSKQERTKRRRRIKGCKNSKLEGGIRKHARYIDQIIFT